MERSLSAVLFVPVVVVTVLAFAAIIRRLLGVRVGLVRTLLAAVLAMLVTAPILSAFAPSDPATVGGGEAFLLGTASLLVAAVLAMASLVVLEVLLPTGSLPGPVEAWRDARRRVERTRRYSTIVRIVLRHGLGRFLRGRSQPGPTSAAARRRLARSLRAALDEGGVTFVKIGQLLSTRRDLLPVEFADELTALQDRATPVPWAEIEAVLTAELGRPFDEVFRRIDRDPLAAASVAQVHAAQLVDGTEVVVKVQRPGITRVVERDLDILLRLGGMLEERTTWGRAFGVRGLASGFAAALREELDFTVERDNLRAMAAALAGSPEHGVRVPTAYPAISSERVLVMDRLPGTPLGAAAPVLARFDERRRAEIAAGLLDCMLDQILVHGVFHVDLHPGNLLLDDDGSLGLLDLGSVGRIDPVTRTAIGSLLLAVGRGDSVAVTDALLQLLDRPGDVDERELQRVVGALIVRYAAPGSTVGVAAVSALLNTFTAHGLGVPPPVAAVFRAVTTLEGTLALVHPEFDLVGQARASAGRRIAGTLTPGNLRDTLEQELSTILPMLRGLPRRIDRIGDAIEHGRLRFAVRLFADDQDRRLVTGLLHQVLLTVIGATAGLMATLLLGIDGGPRVSTGVALFPLLGYGLLVVSVVLVLRVLVTVFRRD
ncbi:ABC1 kinase family protein [Paractinoplanes abujensis]|uniref:Ubiquinone biosynthesis protein n=1 Tax=Paractinoplanes abujensis TaxID=882441 RepID=A0A7W7G2L8_9ACTN|nr:AarF/ABC1/UbiB kinase family protein [Actinoplanes abujensis]MBB4693295.1 ubiquinone biosynthesis protein [Actinoplanes abujensis]